MRKKLGEILTASGAVTQADLDAALSDQTAGEPARLGDLLVALGKITPLQLARALSSQHALPFVQLPPIPDEVLNAIPLDFQRQHRLIPFRVQGEAISIAMADPANTDAIDQLRTQIKKRITRYVAASDDIEGKHGSAGLEVPTVAGTPASHPPTASELFGDGPSLGEDLFSGLGLAPAPPGVPAAPAIAPVRAVPPVPAVKAAALPPAAASKSPIAPAKVPAPAPTKGPAPIPPRPAAPPVAPAVAKAIAPTKPFGFQSASSPPPVEGTMIEELPGEQSGLNELFASLSPAPPPAAASPASRRREEEDEPAFFEATPLKAGAPGLDLTLSDDVSFEVPASEGLTSSPSGTFQLNDAELLEPAGGESSGTFEVSFGETSGSFSASAPEASAPADAGTGFELSVGEASGDFPPAVIEPSGSFEVAFGESSGDFPPPPPPRESAPFELSVSESSGDFGAGGGVLAEPSGSFELSAPGDEGGLNDPFAALESPAGEAPVPESSGSFEVSLDAAPAPEAAPEIDDFFSQMPPAPPPAGEGGAFSEQAEEALTLEELPEELSPEPQASDFPFAPPPPPLGEVDPGFSEAVPVVEDTPFEAAFEAPPASAPVENEWQAAPELEVPPLEASPAPAPSAAGPLPSWLSPSAEEAPPAAAAAPVPGLVLEPGEWTGALDDVAPSRLIAAAVKVLLSKGLLTEAEILGALARKS